MAATGFEFSVNINAPQRVMWEIITNHLRYPEWLPAKKVELEREGEPEKFGLGAVRVFKAGRITTAREEVVGWEPPRSMSYVLHSSFPLRNYHSTMTLIPDGPDRCQLFWKSTMDSVLPLWLGGNLVTQMVKRMLQRAAGKMARAGEAEA